MFDSRRRTKSIYDYVETKKQVVSTTKSSTSTDSFNHGFNSSEMCGFLPSFTGMIKT